MLKILTLFNILHTYKLRHIKATLTHLKKRSSLWNLATSSGKVAECNQLNNPHLILLNPAGKINVSNAYFLQSTDLLQLYFSLSSVFNFML